MEEYEDILQQWSDTPLGKITKKAISDQLKKLVGDFFAHYCLQIGFPSQANWLENVSNAHHCTLNASSSLTKNAVKSSIELLPFKAESVDFVFLPLCLEFIEDIEPLLSEVSRILTPNSRVLICSINPFSWWGLAKYAGYTNSFPFPETYLRSDFKLRNQLMKVGLETNWTKYFFYRPPFASHNHLQKSLFCEEIAKMLWPYPGGLYFLQAQKSMSSSLSMRSKFHFKKRFISSSLTEPLSNKNFAGDK